MNAQTKGVIFLSSFLIIAISTFVIIFNLQNKQSDQDEKRRLSIIGNIHFKGKVINSKVYDFAGKDYYMICVQLDTCNVKNFYVLNDLCALKIRNNIATMCAGVFLPDEGVVSFVEVNINNDRKIKYYYKNGDIHKFELSLGNGGLTTIDMNLCN